ncbi:XP_029636814.1uncharacterized protein LOC115212114 [Octopus vulgaris]|uniref:XP_029636814.1uncharacterized protein LOC115212114 n=1 Tax=Octopus vulgaris TaxID=6645 RepID=A0AA36AVW8_OCTVU|nr:XP_029636814.1uncharacterized protein LOC115212114 [Octopus vulgaris]
MLSPIPVPSYLPFHFLTIDTVTVGILKDDNGNLYPSFETPNAIKDKKFTLKCNFDTGTIVWFTGNGTIIAKYTGTVNQNYPKYFGSRQETSCQEKICTLSITSISLDEENMSIICSSGLHTSMFNITVFVLPKSVTIKSISNTVPVENQNKSYECLIKDTNPEFSVFWLITKNDGTQKNVTKYISNKTSKSGKLSTLSSELTLTLNKNFKKLQCVAYFPGKNEFDNHSKELDLHIKYSPERDDLTLNVSGGKVCVDIPIKFHCSWKGGDPPADVILMYKNISETRKEEVEINVIPSKSHQTVKCLGIHIAANVSREKNLTIHYPPDMVEIKADEPFLEGDKGILHCKARNGYPEKNSYRWDPSNKTSQNFTFPQLNRTHNNEVYTCYASNKCSKGELHKTHWINVEYSPDITAPENVTLFEDQASIINCSAKGNPTPEVCESHVQFSIKCSKKRNVSNGETVILKQCFYSHPKSDVKWQKNEESIDSNKYLITDYLPNEFPFKGNCTSLKLEDIKDDDIGTYTLTVENSIGKETVVFTLTYKEKREIPMGIIIGCTVGFLLLLIIMSLLAYKFYKRRAIKNNNEFSSTKAINTIDGRDLQHRNTEDVHEVANAIYDSSGHLTDLNTEDIYVNVTQKPNNMNAKVNKPGKKTNDVNELYAKVNKPSKQADDVEDLYAKVNKPRMQTDDVEELYAKVNKPRMQTDDVNDLYAKVNKPSKKTYGVNDLNVNKPSKKPEETEDGSLNDNYESNNQSNEPESVQECNYAELEFLNNPGTSKPAPKPVEETIYADLILDS